MVGLAKVAGLPDPEHLDLLRWGNNVSFGHASGHVFRVSLHPAGTDLAQQEVQTARALRHADVPAARLSDLWPVQPLATSVGAVTVWLRIEGRPAGTNDYESLGEVLARWHGIHSLPRGLTPVWEVERRAQRLPDLGEAAERSGCPPEYDFIVAELGAGVLGDPSPLLESSVDEVICHGDAHPGNVILTDEGPVLVDLEYVGLGCREWDLSEAAVHVRRFGRPIIIWRSLFERYPEGYDEQRLLAMVRVREVKLAAWALRRALTTGHSLDEALLRVRSLMDDELNRTWTPV
ncbi:phosphotransferase family protein [Parafrankia elaeagni]|uniref:phosphotransferase family protein n=1 Tax=Parafrankia elaeagni TaxID=222534 RepID=UPI0003AA21F3|nr:aminoglycoside phosphotransferase family protein [Parafrankia elaeagni]